MGRLSRRTAGPFPKSDEGALENPCHVSSHEWIYFPECIARSISIFDRWTVDSAGPLAFGRWAAPSKGPLVSSIKSELHRMNGREDRFISPDHDVRKIFSQYRWI